MGKSLSVSKFGQSFLLRRRIPLQQEDEQVAYRPLLPELGLLLQLGLGARVRLLVIDRLDYHVGHYYQVRRGSFHDATNARRSSHATHGMALYDKEPADVRHQRPQINASNHSLNLYFLAFMRSQIKMYLLYPNPFSGRISIA